ncbi:FimV/HubP family polar landmark protein [Variovorax ureilyticus]|uniref:FimV/HubP family polar landmark protein n=1 Tax=Variovorax ureilyticus TaxID=1836198 RepID=A0ABU8VP85_9BURK
MRGDDVNVLLHFWAELPPSSMTRPSSPAARLSAISPAPKTMGRGQLSVLSAAVAVALGAFSAEASALALGRLNVQSALGEPLRAEIEVTEVTAAEADGLKVNIASVDAFKAAGVPYNPALSDVRVGVQRRADGRYVVRLSSNRLVSEPFIDLLLEANWSSGRVVRDYTVLLDPPTTRQAAAPVAPTAPQITAAPRTAAPAVVEAPQTRRQRTAAAAPAAASGESNNVRTGTGAGAGAGDQQVTVKAGDTASKIASAYKPAEVSLDQMLVALLRANPNAFVGGNVNRMKTGAVLDIPSSSQAEAVTATEAKRTVTAQSQDFSQYRRRLADNAPETPVADAGRQAAGKVQTNVEDRNAANAATDKLKISQGIAPGRPTDEQIAQAAETKARQDREKELTKNLQELNQLKAAAAGGANATSPAPAPAQQAAAAPAAAPATPATAAPAPSSSGSAQPLAAAAPAGQAAPAVVAQAALPAPVAPTEATAAAPAASPAPTPAAAAAPAPAVKPPVKAAAPAPAPKEQSFFSELMENPLMVAAAALVALLISFLLYRVLGRKRRDAGDSVFIESRIPKDSFFGASGGESVDTKNRGNSVVSSLSYSPSQLDAGDVDPVAEADVYLAYGRDLQAEEILREALRVNPERTAIHLKLLEIHAKRRDLRAYEALASEVHKLTGGTGTEWNRVVELGKDLDPGNPLYEADGKTVSAAEAAAFAGTLAAASAVVSTPAPGPVAQAEAEAPPPAFVPSVAPLDFDLDLSNPPATAATAPAPINVSLPAAAPIQSPIRDTPRPIVVPGGLNGGAAATHAPKVDIENDFDTAPGALEPGAGGSTLRDEERTQPAPLRAGLPTDSGFIEFDMSSLAGLSTRTPGDTERGRLEPADEGGDNPHVIKLSLARELKALGDVEGARSLVEEVAAESSGDVKAEAKQMLGQLR